MPVAGSLSSSLRVENKISSKRSLASAARSATYRATFHLTKHEGYLVIAIAALITGWYSLSLILIATNKILLDSLAFPYPLVVTFVHFAGVALFVKTFTSFCYAQYPNAPNLTVDSHEYISVILPISFFTAIEIALSNQAYSMVSLSVMTVVKSTLVAATYVTSIFAGLEVFRLRLMLVLLWIISSVAFSVPGMEVTNPFGVFVLALAVICGAGRWVLVHKQLQGGGRGSLDLICLTQPLAAFCLFPAALVYDMPDMIANLAVEPTDSQRVCATMLLMTVAILVACALLICEYKLIQLTSSLTLTVAGVGKECLTVGMSTVLFKERVTWKGGVGLISSIAGIAVYTLIRHQLAHGGEEMEDTEGKGRQQGWRRESLPGVSKFEMSSFVPMV